jgi:S-DNA-T family DNA segregation ATPase FtsK/SpoIIIE
MAEWPLEGQPAGEPDGQDPLAADGAIEGTVVPFPKTAPEPAQRKRVPGAPGELRAIIPEHLRSWAGIKKAIRWRCRRWRHIGLFHLVRSPKMLPLALVWAVVGVIRIEAALGAWAFATEQAYLRGQTIEAADIRAYLQIHKEGKETRLFRVPVLIAAHVLVLVLAAVITVRLPVLWLPIGLIAVPFLAAAGRPDGKPIVESAVIPTAFAQLTFAGVIQALSVLGIAEMNKALRDDPDGAIVPLGPVVRDGNGWLAIAELPPGVTAGQVSEKRENLASGLRRPLGCVWPETMHKRHPGAMALYVSDEDMNAMDMPAWTLARRGQADMFKPTVFAVDARGRDVTITLMFVSIIIGSVPRMGKTFTLRLLLLICALDVRSELHVYDLKGTGDLAPLRPVAHRYRAGDEPEDIEYAIEDMRGLRREMRRRTKVIRELGEKDPVRCPENRVTPELAADKRLGLHPLVIAADECQVWFEHPVHKDEFETICTDLVKRGPALGILIMLATQRPDARSIPTGISANAVLRICLKVQGQTENDMVLGTSQYKAGIRATMFSFDDKGVAYFAGEGTTPRIIRGQGFDLPASKQIAARARALREHAGRITGYALGQDQDGGQARRLLDDVLTVFGEAKALWCSTIAERLAGSFAEAYADITQDAVASQLRNLEVNVRGVRETGRTGDGPRSGCYRAEVEKAAGGGDA